MTRPTVIERPSLDLGLTGSMLSKTGELNMGKKSKRLNRLSGSHREILRSLSNS